MNVFFRSWILVETFHIPSDRTDDDCYVVVVKIGEQQFGVVVNRLRAQEEVVIKSLGEFLANVKVRGGSDHYRRWQSGIDFGYG